MEQTNVKVSANIELSFEGQKRDLELFLKKLQKDNNENFNIKVLSNEIFSVDNKSIDENLYHLLFKESVEFYIKEADLSELEKEIIENNLGYSKFMVSKLNKLSGKIKKDIEDHCYYETYYPEFLYQNDLKVFSTETDLKTLFKISVKIFECFLHFNTELICNNFYMPDTPFVSVDDFGENQNNPYLSIITCEAK